MNGLNAYIFKRYFYKVPYVEHYILTNHFKKWIATNSKKYTIFCCLLITDEKIVNSGKL